MRWALPRPRFGLRTLLLLVLVSALAVGWWTSDSRWRSYTNQQARARIEPYELKIAGDGSPHNVPAELVAILGDSRLQHWFQTGGMKLLPGDQGISLGGDQIARVWDINTGRQTRWFACKSIAVNQQRDRIFLGSADGIVTCYDTASWKALKTFDLKTQFDRLSMAVSGDGSVLVTQPGQVNEQREILIWDVATGTIRHRFHPQGFGGTLLVNGDGSEFAWDEDCQIKVSRTDTGEVLRTVGPVMDDGLRCHPGRLELTGDESQLIVSSAAMHLVIYDWQTGKEIQQLSEGTHGWIQFLLRPDGKSIWVLADGGFQLFKQTEMGWTSAVKYPWPQRESGFDWLRNTITGVRSGRAELWSSAKPEITPRRTLQGAPNAVTCLAFHPDGKRLFAAKSSGQIGIYEVGGWKLQQQWTGHEHAITGMALAANGSKLATSSQDGIAIRDVATGLETCVVRDIWHNEYIGLSPDGGELATALRRGLGAGVELWDTTKGRSVAQIGPVRNVYGSPAWSPDGQHLVCNDYGSVLHLFDVKGKAVAASLGKSRFGQCHLQAKWFADSQQMVTVGWGRDEVHVLEIGKTKPIKTINAGGGRIQCVDLDSSEEYVAVAGNKTPVQIWHLPTSTLVKSWQIGPLEGQVTQVAFSPDGHYLATVNGNGTAYVLNLDGVLP